MAINYRSQSKSIVISGIGFNATNILGLVMVDVCIRNGNLKEHNKYFEFFKLLKNCIIQLLIMYYNSTKYSK